MAPPDRVATSGQSAQEPRHGAQRVEDGLRAGIVIVMFAGAVWSDLRIRRVRNTYWLPFLAVAAVLWTTDVLEARRAEDLLWPVAGTLGVMALAHGFWWIGGFGGADAKGLMVAALLWPGVPDLLAARTVPALDVLMNGAMLTLVVPLAALLVNLARGDLALPAMLLGVRMPLAEARARHVWPMQEVRGGALRWRFWHRPSDGLGPTYRALAGHGVARVWITPKVPFMVNLAAGAFMTWVWGDVPLALAGRLVAG